MRQVRGGFGGQVVDKVEEKAVGQGRPPARLAGGGLPGRRPFLFHGKTEVEGLP